MALLIALGGFNVKGENFQRREISVLQVRQTRGALLGEPTHHVPGQDQKAAPRDQRQQRVLRQPRFRHHPLRSLQEEDERHGEQAGDHGKAPAAVEAREDNGQIIEAEKRKLLLDQRIDGEQ